MNIMPMLKGFNITVGILCLAVAAVEKRPIWRIADLILAVSNFIIAIVL